MPDVVLPVLNEAEALPGVLASFPEGFRPIVVDNGSTDDSAQIASAHGASVISEPRRGFGSACLAGLLAATDEIVCFMDADGSLDPGELPKLVELVQSGQADLALGSRQPEPGAWPWHARAANRYLAFELRRRGAGKLTDLGPMRAARREPLIALGTSDLRFGWPLEMVVRAAQAGWTVAELPVTYKARSGGKSKVSGSVRGTARAIKDMSAVLATTSGQSSR